MQISDTKGSWCEDSKSSFQGHLVSTGRDPRLLSNRKLSPGSAFRKDLWFKMKREDRSIKKNYMYISPLKAPRRLNVWDFWKLLGVTIFWVRFLVMWVDAIGTQDTCKTTAMVPVPLKPRLPGPEAAAACARRRFGDSGEAQAGFAPGSAPPAPADVCGHAWVGVDAPRLWLRQPRPVVTLRPRLALGGRSFSAQDPSSSLLARGGKVGGFCVFGSRHLVSPGHAECGSALARVARVAGGSIRAQAPAAGSIPAGELAGGHRQISLSEN